MYTPLGRDVNRHGTLKGRWKALAFGAVWIILGFLVARPSWRAMFAMETITPPGATGLALIFGGGLLIVLGVILGVTPHFLWLLRTFYKEDFAPGARCPIMVVCPSCHAYNPRGRRACGTCSAAMEGARAAGAP
jgi:hypothetical protein